jgi:hypothetical protein
LEQQLQSIAATLLWQCTQATLSFYCFEKLLLVLFTNLAGPQEARVQLRKQLQQQLINFSAVGFSKHLSPEALDLVTQAVHLGADPETLLLLLDGSLGATLSATAASSAEAGNPNATIAGVVRGPGMTGSEASLNACRSVSEVQHNHHHHQKRYSSMGRPHNEGLGNCSSSQREGPVSVLPFLELVGVLAERYRHDESELGGPVTAALRHAQLSTQERVAELESQARGLHREVVILKRTLAEQRKQETERIEAALKDQQRKIARRGARQPTLIEKFIQTKWGDYFEGIGTVEELPRVLRANVPINNK